MQHGRNVTYDLFVLLVADGMAGARDINHGVQKLVKKQLVSRLGGHVFANVNLTFFVEALAPDAISILVPELRVSLTNEVDGPSLTANPNV